MDIVSLNRHAVTLEINTTMFLLQ